MLFARRPPQPLLWRDQCLQCNKRKTAFPPVPGQRIRPARYLTQFVRHIGPERFALRQRPDLFQGAVFLGRTKIERLFRNAGIIHRFKGEFVAAGRAEAEYPAKNSLGPLHMEFGIDSVQFAQSARIGVHEPREKSVADGVV